MSLRLLVYVTDVAALVFCLRDIFAAQLQAGLLGGSLNAFGIGAVQFRRAVGLLYAFLAFFSRHADEKTLKQGSGANDDAWICGAIHWHPLFDLDQHV